MAERFSSFSKIVVATAGATLAACTTPAQMHTEAQLNQVATGCGLALGELMQDDSEKRLLISMHNDPSLPQRICIAKWARQNGLKAVFVNVKFQG